jgi:hypothetical protein
MREMQNYNDRRTALYNARNGAGQQEPSSSFSNDNNVNARADENPENINEAVQQSGGKSEQQLSKKSKKKKRTLNIVGVLAEINFMNDIPFFLSFFSSTLKEILDIVLSATIILPWVFSLVNTIFNLMMMQLAKFNEEVKVHSRLMIKIILLILGCFFDSIPGLDFLPISLMTIIIVYFMTLWERVKAKKN